MRVFGFVSFFVLLVTCAVAPVPESKINGVSFVAHRIAVDSSHVKPVLNIHANSAAVMPFGFIRELSSPEIIYNTDRQWFGETLEGAKHYIEELNANGLSVMLKPQIWIWRGEFTGLLKMETEAQWVKLEQSYTNFIMDYAQLAQEMEVEVFCIGTELELFIKHRPDYWNQLILQVKATYSGRITYAANWDEYKRTPFWKQLDFIGVDAYFPISSAQTPSLDSCLKGWEKQSQELSEFSKQWGKPILFTEFGYRSVDYTAKEPWRYDRSMTSINLQAQNNAMEALFQTVWNQPWFAGGYLWKWFVNHDEVGGLDNNQFTPQNKPVEDIVAKYYAKFSSS